MVVGTCSLCLAPNIELQSSHVLPSWAYARLRARGDNSQADPVSIHGGRAFQTSKQVTAPLLCRNCEQRFGLPERYVSELCRDGDAVAPIVQLLRRRPEEESASDELAELQAADADTLAFFALSVVWRTHLIDGGVTLGPYADTIRRYLTGDTPFPTRVRVWLTVFKPFDGLLSQTVTSATSVRVDGCHKHSFILCGLEFTVLTGAVLPSYSDALCLVRGNPKRVLVAPLSTSAGARQFVTMATTASPAKKLAARTARGVWRRSPH